MPRSPSHLFLGPFLTSAIWNPCELSLVLLSLLSLCGTPVRPGVKVELV